MGARPWPGGSLGPGRNGDGQRALAEDAVPVEFLVVTAV